MLSYFFYTKRDHEEFVKEIPTMDDEELLSMYHVLSEDMYLKNTNRFTRKELRLVYKELKKRKYVSCTGEVLDFKIHVRNAG